MKIDVMPVNGGKRNFVVHPPILGFTGGLLERSDF